MTIFYSSLLETPDLIPESLDLPRCTTNLFEDTTLWLAQGSFVNLYNSTAREKSGFVFHNCMAQTFEAIREGSDNSLPSNTVRLVVRYLITTEQEIEEEEIREGAKDFLPPIATHLVVQFLIGSLFKFRVVLLNFSEDSNKLDEYRNDLLKEHPPCTCRIAKKIKQGELVSHHTYRRDIWDIELRSIFQ